MGKGFISIVVAAALGSLLAGFLANQLMKK
jgi:hypothetical protein